MGGGRSAARGSAGCCVRSRLRFPSAFRWPRGRIIQRRRRWGGGGVGVGGERASLRRGRGELSAGVLHPLAPLGLALMAHEGPFALGAAMWGGLGGRKGHRAAHWWVWGLLAGAGRMLGVLSAPAAPQGGWGRPPGPGTPAQSCALPYSEAPAPVSTILPPSMGRNCPACPRDRGAGRWGGLGRSRTGDNRKDKGCRGLPQEPPPSPGWLRWAGTSLCEGRIWPGPARLPGQARRCWRQRRCPDLPALGSARGGSGGTFPTRFPTLRGEIKTEAREGVA